MNKFSKISIAVLIVISVGQANAQVLGVPGSLDPTELIQNIKGDAKSNAQQDDIPGGDEGYLYRMGTGGVDRISVPPIVKVTRNYSAGFSAGLGYSCGKFNPFSNVEQMMNQVVEKFKKMPQQFVSAAQEAVSAMPAYVMNKINPTLYNTITKNLDDAFELFNIEFKSCKDWEAGITNEAGTYFDYFKAAKNDAMRNEIASNTGKPIDEVNQDAAEKGASDGLVGAGGEKKGGDDQDPFSAMNEVILSGYNMLLNRKETEESKPSGDLAKAPMVKVFDSPKTAQDWASAIYGNREWSLPEEKSKSKAQSGTGMRYQFNAHRYHLMELLKKLIDAQMTMETFKKQTGGIQLANAELIDIRRLTPYARDIVIQQISQREAIRDMRMRLQFMKNILEAGLEDPSMIQSTSGAIVKQEVGLLIARISEDLHQLTILSEQG